MEKWPRFAERTRIFEALYRDVSQEILNYTATKQDPYERAWLDYLVRRFLAEYHGWETKQHMWPVLDAIEARSGLLMPTFALHIYLHIYYDLPRVLADSLSNETREFGSLTRKAKGELYQELTPLFESSFRRSAGSRSVMGPWLMVTAPFSWSHLSQAFPLTVIIAMRAMAWNTATQLADSGERDQEEEELLANILRLIKRANFIDLLTMSRGGPR